MLQIIVGMAIADHEFRGELLSCPLSAVQGFDLADEELAAIASIRAKTLEQFAARLDLWLSRLPLRRERRPRDIEHIDAIRAAG